METKNMGREDINPTKQDRIPSKGRLSSSDATAALGKQNQSHHCRHVQPWPALSNELGGKRREV